MLKRGLMLFLALSPLHKGRIVACLFKLFKYILSSLIHLKHPKGGIFISSQFCFPTSAEAGPVFENVTHTRFLLLASSYALLIDELTPTDGKEHTYDWLYHNNGQSISSTLPRKYIKLEHKPQGYAYLRDVNAYSSANSQPFGVKFTGGKTSVYMTMAGQAYHCKQ